MRKAQIQIVITAIDKFDQLSPYNQQFVTSLPKVSNLSEYELSDLQCDHFEDLKENVNDLQSK